ncbi:MAG TPA: flagellar basal body rod protein FlgB [Xanthobacteraceae bacterium]|nr:flagellar basal body rod protein FlgB [Xanthobacteraceae bacterium]
MPISEIPIFSMLRTRMQWHQERQKVLAENVANSDTPNFHPHDLVPLDFTRGGPRGPLVALATTDPAHLAGFGGGTQFAPNSDGQFEIRPAGNAVDHEDQMIRVASNQMDYQMAATLYSRGLNLIKTAIGKS